MSWDDGWIACISWKNLQASSVQQFHCTAASYIHRSCVSCCRFVSEIRHLYHFPCVFVMYWISTIADVETRSNVLWHKWCWCLLGCCDCLRAYRHFRKSNEHVAAGLDPDKGVKPKGHGYHDLMLQGHKPNRQGFVKHLHKVEVDPEGVSQWERRVRGIDRSHIGHVIVHWAVSNDSISDSAYNFVQGPRGAEGVVSFPLSWYIEMSS